jgi:hypothetical protein
MASVSVIGVPAMSRLIAPHPLLQGGLNQVEVARRGEWSSFDDHPAGDPRSGHAVRIRTEIVRSGVNH